MAWKTSSTGQRVFVPEASERKTAVGLSSDTQVKDVNKLSTPTATPTKPTREDIKAVSKARGEAEFDRPKPTGTTYDPSKALQDRPTGGAPVSPYVGGEGEPVVPPVKPAPPTVTGAPTATEGVTPTETETAEEELTPGFEQWEQEHGILFDQAEELKDTKIESYEQLQERQIARLDELQGMMEELTKQKNALVAGSAKVQQAEINAAYDANKENLKIAKERLENTQRKVLAEREKQLARKTMNEENMLAVIGGFGSMAGNKMLLDSIDEGEDKIAWLKTEFSLQDMEHSNKVVQLNNDYKNDKLKIEQWKQEKIMQNYENLQSFIANIIKDEDRSDVDKVNAINAAKDQYNNTISSLHKDVIDARFDLSRDIIKRSDVLRKEAEAKILEERAIEREDIEFARADLAMLSENYALENFAGLPEEVKARFDELEKESGLPPGFTEQAIKNFQTQENAENMQIRFEKDNQGNITIIGVNKQTGLVEATSQVLGAGTTKSTTPSNPIEKAFNVGSEGGWCGTYASTISTAAKVGNTWVKKLEKVTHWDNPTPGDKLLLPLGVTDASSDFGHVAVVLAYNPESGLIQVTESNKDGRQNRGEGQGVISFGDYNINDIKKQCGETGEDANWGFIEGELKGDYAKHAAKLGLTEGSAPVSTAGPTPATEPAGPDYESEFGDV